MPQAAAELSAKRLAKIILLGSEEEIKGLAQKANADISQVQPVLYLRSWLCRVHSFHSLSADAILSS